MRSLKAYNNNFLKKTKKLLCKYVNYIWEYFINLYEMGSLILSPYSSNYCYMSIKSEEPKTKDNINNKTHQYPTKENWFV